MNNKARVMRARKALISYWTGFSSLDEAVIDLLTDLQHLCADEKLDFAPLQRQASEHFKAEKKGGID